jgi:predicted TIM-barrel fold metal-dependent hydrolase
MEKPRIIDAHTHVFPARIADKASASIGSFYDMPVRMDGCASTLLAAAASAGIGHCVIFSTATHPDQVCAINDFIADTASGSLMLTGLGTMHPGLSPAAIRKEARRIAGIGLKGIKLHPDFQAIYPDTDDMYPIYKSVIDNGLCMVIHAGDHRHPYSHPARIAAVARRFPSLDMVASHMGGWSQWAIGRELLSPLPNVRVDTSSTMPFITAEEMVDLLHAFGSERVLFGSDYPMWDPGEELRRFLALPLGEEDRQAILFDNAARFFRIEGAF